MKTYNQPVTQSLQIEPNTILIGSNLIEFNVSSGGMTPGNIHVDAI